MKFFSKTSKLATVLAVILAIYAQHSFCLEESKKEVKQELKCSSCTDGKQEKEKTITIKANYNFSNDEVHFIAHNSRGSIVKFDS